MKAMLFNTKMVRAILAERKAVTRRLIKPQPYNVLHNGELQQDEIEDGDVLITSTEAGKTEMIIPPYQPGDVLYVRETWCKVRSLTSGVERYLYRADDSDFYCHWKPSIHMPKEAARIFLRVTNVRVERLQDISQREAEKEGQPDCVGLTTCGGSAGCPMCEASYENSILWFEKNWSSTVKKSDLDKYGWDSNPWVWVISFERISKEEALENA